MLEHHYQKLQKLTILILISCYHPLIPKFGFDGNKARLPQLRTT
uniref:Uncharacterized protein n=1 Tax=Rhizophora mucronata TaxID=61149 RepID=A0A2P2QR48_RHIMU